MKKFFSTICLAALFAPCAVYADNPANGSCRSKADRIDPTESHSQTVTLVRSWDDEENTWTEDEPKEFQTGVHWYYANFAKKGNYTVWVSGNDYLLVDFYDGMGDPSDLLLSYSKADVFDGTDEDITYYYIRSEDWESESPDTYRIYFCVNGDIPDEQCTLHVQSNSISKFVPKGDELNPIAIDVANASSVVPSNPNGGGLCYFTTTLQKSNTVVFVATPAAGYDIEALELELTDEETVLLTDSLYTDPYTGVYILKVMADRDAAVTLKMSGDNLGSANLAWRGLSAGEIGFAETSCKVRDDCGQVVLTVRRTSNDFDERIRWSTVADTALPGIDYVPASGELEFKADEDYVDQIPVTILPGGLVDGRLKSLSIRLESVPKAELGEKEYSPDPSPRVARVFIEPTALGEPIPNMPAAEQEGFDTPLARGTFRGVAEDLGAEIAMTSRANGVVSVVVSTGAGQSSRSYAFEGDANEVSCTQSIAGKNWTMYLSVSLPDGTVADLASAPGGVATLSGSIYVLGDDGVEERFISCALYREETRLDSATLGRMRRKAGVYTVALEASAGEWTGGDDVSKGGYLTVDVSAGGEAIVSGLLPGGGRIESLDATAYDVADGIAIPILAETDCGNLVGTLKLGGAPCEISCYCGRILASGGKYDYWTLLERLYAGWCLVPDQDAGAFASMEFLPDGGKFSVFGVPMVVNLDRKKGILSGTLGGDSFEAVLLNHDMVNGEIGAMGTLVTSGGTRSSAFKMYLNWLDPTWEQDERQDVEVTVSFDLNGGSAADIGDLKGKIGLKLVLPEVVPTKANRAFVGWFCEDANAFYGPGEVISVPPEDTTLVATWADSSLSAALDCDLDIYSAPEGSWNVANNAAAVDGTCLAVSGIGAGKKVSVSSYVVGPGLLTFRWAVVSRVSMKPSSTTQGKTTANDSIVLTVDGKTVATAAEISAFAQSSVSIADAGPHLLEWTYITDNTSHSGVIIEQGYAWLDGVYWDPYTSDQAMITLNPGEGGSVSPTRVSRQIYEPIGALPVPSMAGKGFVRWVDADTGVTFDEETLMPYDDLTLRAVWGYEVSFAAGGANGMPPAKVAAEIGDSVTLPGLGGLVKEDYDFVGWSEDNGTTLRQPGDSYSAELNTVMTAQWADARYRVALNTDLPVAATSCIVSTTDSDDGKCVASKVSASGGKAVLTATVSGEGTVAFSWKMAMTALNTGAVTPSDRMDFYVDNVSAASLTSESGWARVEHNVVGEGVHELKWVFTASTVSGRNLQYLSSWGRGCLDAVDWTPAGGFVTVTFDAAGGECGEASRRVATNSVVGTLPTPVRVGFDFAGWYLDGTETKVEAGYGVGVEDFTLVAQWDVRRYDVTFDANGGVGGGTVSMDHGSALGDLPVPTREGDYVFLGWFTAASGGEQVTPATVVTGAATYWAHWAAGQRVVVFDANGGVGGGTVVREAGAQLGELPSAEREGCVLLGWFTAASGGEQVTSETVVTANATDYAHWGAAVSFSAGGASGAAPAAEVVELGSEWSLPSASGLAKPDCVFAGWSDGEKTYQAGDRYEVVRAVTFTATWRNAKYEAALDCVNLEFAAESDSAWTSSSDSDARGGACLASKVSASGGKAVLTATVSGEGTVAFSWKMAMTALNTGAVTPSDRMDFYVDNVSAASLTSESGWARVEHNVVGEGVHELKWVFTASTVLPSYLRYLSSWGKGCLDAVEWTPSGISTGPGTPFEGADDEELAKATSWMEANGLTAADMNSLKFSVGNSGDPLDSLSEAYLLNCAPENVEEAKAAFEITHFSVDSEGNIFVEPADGSGYGNGFVEARYSASPSGEFLPERPKTAGAMFMRIYLVK